jgi:3-isopropylmalate dehydratase small subunit
MSASRARTTSPRPPKNPNFVLNQPRYQGAQVLLTRENFGCGSVARARAVGAAGFRLQARSSPSFADIFFNNCFKNGMLPIVLPAEIDALFAQCEATPGLPLTIDLPAQTVIRPDGKGVPFDRSMLPQGMPAQRLGRHRPDAAPRRQDPRLRRKAPHRAALAVFVRIL